MALTTITVTGTYKDATGAAQAGSVMFTPSWPLTSSSNTEFLTQTAVVAPLLSGSFSVTLACTDNASLLPTGWAYVVNVAVPGQQSVFNVYLPSTLGASVDLSALAPDESTTTPAVPLTGTITPGSAAGGDLSGTYPNPRVLAVHGVVVSGTPVAGQVLTATSATTATWAAP